MKLLLLILFIFSSHILKIPKKYDNKNNNYVLCMRFLNFDERGNQ